MKSNDDSRLRCATRDRRWRDGERLSHPPGGQPAKLTPDFLVLMTDGTTFVEDVKSGGLDDNAAIVRMKAAAELFPLWVFRLVRPIPKRDGGGWAWHEV